MKNVRTVRKQYVPAKLRKKNMGYEAFLKGDPAEEVKKRAAAVIAQEAPVSDRLLRKRVLNSLGIQRSGSSVTMVMDAILQTMPLFDSEEGTERFFWKDEKQRKTYAEYRVSDPDDENKRDILDISAQEIANAVCSVLGEESLPEEELIRSTANRLGYTRIGSNVRRRVKDALVWGCGKKKFCVKNGTYML